MYYVGVDLHKKSISLCVVVLVDRARKIVERRKFHCEDEEQMAEYFANLGEYQLVVEATASYVWYIEAAGQLDIQRIGFLPRSQAVRRRI
jgi:hypothetical protein